MKHTFKRAMSLFMALAMVLTMVPSFGTHVHAEELETEPVVMTEEPATEAPVVEAPETEAAETEAPTQALETEAPATEAPVVETEAPEVTEEAPEVVETEPAEETEAIEETFPEEILEEEIIEEEAVAVITEDLSGFAVTGLTPSWNCKSTEKNGSVVAVGNTITIKAKGGSLRKTKIELTLTNDLGSEAKLKFSYTYDSGNFEGASNGSFEKVLENGGKVTVTFEAARNSESTLSITDISLISTTAADANLTFKAPANGTYTVDGTPVAADTQMTVSAGTALALVATPDSGYQFFGWQRADGTYLSQDAVYTLTAAQDETITPVFIDAAVALFGVGAAKYMDLTEAGAAAAAGTVKTIILLNNGTVSGSHTIPAGTTLLIPYDDANTAYGATASCTSWSSKTDASGHIAWESPVAYRTLTLASGASIAVNGNIEVSGRHAAAAASSPNNGRYGGSPTGKLGYINMESGSHIDLNSGANLYAWGYVYGDGTITAKSGASIYENFQVMDFRGGTATSALATEFRVFPLSQYYVQNVEVATRYEYGASEYIATSIFMSNQCFSATVKFIGDGAMFQPAAGSYFTKDYNPATDRLEMHAYGNSTMASMSLELGGTGIDSSDFILPITNNIEIHLHTGTTTLKQNMMLLPGSSLSIDQGAILDLAYTDATGEIVTAGGHMLQVFDSENWGRGLNVETLEDTTGLSFVHPNKQFAPLEYTCTKRHSRTIADLTDVTVDVNGTVITNGFVYSTVNWKDPLNENFTIVSGGANIISSGKTGSFAMNNGAGQDMMGFMFDQGKSSYYIIPIASAQLRNGDGTYLDTTGAEAGATYNYCARGDHWFLGDECADVHGVEITWANLGFTDNYTEEFAIGAIPEYKGATPTQATANCKAYTFAGWETEADGTGTKYPIGTALPAATTDATYFAYFTESDAHIDEGMDHLCDNCNTQISKCEYGETEYYWADDYTDCAAMHQCQYCSGLGVSSALSITHEVNTPATCMAKGSITYTATFAVEWAETQTKTVEVEKNPENHTKQNTTVKDAVDATCGAEGYTGDTYCECGVKIANGSEIPATGNHSFTNKPSDKKKDDATCISAATYYVQCDNCDEVDYQKTVAAGEADPANHVNTHVAKEWTPGENNDHFHWVVCDDCKNNIDKKNIGDCFDTDGDGDHNCNLCGRENITDHFGGTANCQSPAICEECGKAYGELDRDFHAGEVTVSYLNTQKHKTTFSCCEGVELIEEHNNETGDDDACDVCGAIQVLVMKVFPDGLETELVWAEAGEDFVYSLSDENYNLIAMAQSGAQPIAAVVKKGENGALTIPEVSASMRIMVMPVYIGRLNFNGGTFAQKEAGDVYKSMGLTVTDEYHETVVPVGSGTSHTVDTYSRDGWNLVGYKVNGTEYSVDESYSAASDGFVVDLIWKCAGHVYDNDCDADCNKCGETREVADHVSDAAYPCLPGKCVNCGADVAASVNHSFTNYESNNDASCTADGTETAKCDYNCGASDTRVAVGSKLNHEWGNPTYVDNKDGTHTVTYVCVLDGINTDTKIESHTFENGECVCEAKQTFILTVNVLATGEYVELTVPYGANLLEVLDQAVADKKIPAIGEIFRFNTWEDIVTGYSYLDENGEWIYDLEGLTMPAGDFAIDQDYGVYRGWQEHDVGTEYVDPEKGCLEGWNYIDDDFDDVEGGAWYYFQKVTVDDMYYYVRVEGISRVPYPTEAINGITYAPNAEDLAYEDFIDAEEAWFVFDENGKFESNITGVIGNNQWAVKGQIVWHPGLVFFGEYLYFIGDVENGGNKLATGDVYISRIFSNGGRDFTIGGIYTFGENGLLIDNHGIVDMGNGTKRYYQNAQLMAGAGLIEVPVDNNDNYAFIFVRGNGELVVNTKYWVGANDLNVVPGLYAFDENGYMINPAPADKNGVFAEDGALYFYENGKRTYKGLIKYGDGIIYVTTSGKLATGKYYVTKTDLIEGYEPGFYFFDAEGYMEITTRNGIVDGKFYVDGEVQYGAGLIEYNDGLIYVRSNGEVVIDQAYWITNTNNLLPAGCYEFDSEGYLQIDESLDGVVGLNYYIDGVKQFGNGLVKVEDGYIYVKTNGELATGTYWITRTNGLMSAGCYEFDTDGYMLLG